MSDRDAVEVQLPRLSAGNYRITSSKTTAYNCFAWAAKDTTRVWSPVMLGGGVYWPPGIPALPSLSGVVELELVGGAFYGEPSVYMRRATRDEDA